MRVTISLFAQMRLDAGVSSVALELPPGATLASALERFYEAHPTLRAHGASALAAIGLEYAPLDQLLREGDEISLIPPVQGG